MVKLFSKNSNLCDYNSPTLQTDRQTDRRTDRQTTCDRNTALCTKVHRAVKTVGRSRRISPPRSLTLSLTLTLTLILNQGGEILRERQTVECCAITRRELGGKEKAVVAHCTYNCCHRVMNIQQLLLQENPLLNVWAKVLNCGGSGGSFLCGR